MEHKLTDDIIVTELAQDDPDLLNLVYEQGPIPAINMEDLGYNYAVECPNCGNSPVISLTGMCSVCTFGEADALDEHL